MTEPTKRGPGRPRLYTPEEAIERRRKRQRDRKRNGTPEQKARWAEQAREWREANPEKVEEWRLMSYAQRQERLREDPEYRAQYNGYQAAYQQRLKEES